MGGKARNVPTGSPKGARRPPEPLFSSCCSSSFVVGMWSLLSLDMLMLAFVAGLCSKLKARYESRRYGSMHGRSSSPSPGFM